MADSEQHCCAIKAEPFLSGGVCLAAGAGERGWVLAPLQAEGHCVLIPEGGCVITLIQHQGGMSSVAFLSQSSPAILMKEEVPTTW